MAKRNATTELNHDNWNDEETPEEAGSFQKASADELKKRVIKTAKRRSAGLGNGSTKSAFAGFEGFKTAGSTPQAASFSFGTSSSSSSSNGIASESTNTKTTHQASSVSHIPVTSTTTVTKDEKSSENTHSREYYAQLKGLNESVSAWIKSHVDKNPICILTPIFRDYERYLTDIEESEKQKKKDKANESSTTSPTKVSSADTGTASTDKTFSFTLGPKLTTASTTSSTVTTTTSSPSFFGSASSFQNAKIEMPGSGFIFGKKAEDSKDSKSVKNEVNPFLSSTRENFNFGQAQSSLGGSSASFPSAGFTFGGTSTFTFSSGAKSDDKKDDDKPAEKDDDEDEAPKDEFKPIVEDDALYTKRCKLFVKKEGKFNECGIGTLHVKPVPEEEGTEKKKIQVVVRADNAIGTVLLNVLLGGSSALPAPTRVGRNNVMLVCPLPSESDNVPLPVLVRVKEEKDADELFSQLTELDK